MAYQSQPQSRLLSLPHQLRDKIYELTFGDQIATVCVFGVARHNCSLLATCKQTQLEATAFYYTHTTFLVHDFRALRWWLERLSQDRRKAIRKILWANCFVLYGPAPSVLNLRRELEESGITLGKGVLGSTKWGIIGKGCNEDEEWDRDRGRSYALPDVSPIKVEDTCYMS